MLRVIEDKILCKRLPPIDTTAGGIFLPESAQIPRIECEVIAVGPGKYLNDGSIIPLLPKVGDIVIVSKFAGIRLDYEHEKYIVFKEQDIIAIANLQK